MASLTKTWTGANSWSGGKLVVSSVPNTAGNYSDVTATLYGCRLDGGKSYNNNASDFYITINGTKKTYTSGITISGTSYTRIFSATVRVYHNGDGNKSITISCGGTITGTSYNLSSVSYSLTLDKIARKSSLTVTKVELGKVMTITIERQDDDFTDTIKWVCGSASGTVCEKTAKTSLSFTPGVELAAQNTLGESVSIEFTLETFNGNTSLGTSSAVAVCTIPASVVPTVSATVTDVLGYVSTFGKYIQGKSKIRVSISAAGAQGSSIVSYNTTVDGKGYADASFTTDEIVNSGSLELVITVTDSRGRKAALTRTLEVYAYSVPKILSARGKRCTANGISSSTGAYLGVVFDAEVTSLDGKNRAAYAVDYKKTTASTYTSKTVSAYANNYAVSNGLYVFPAGEEEYNIILRITDAFGSSEKKISGPGATVFFSRLWRGLGAAFGKIAELEGVFDIGWKARFFGGLLLMAPEDETDLNTLLVPNVYRMHADRTYGNAPETGVDAIFKVMGDEAGLRQTFSVISQTEPRTYERSYAEGAWGVWTREIHTIFEQGTWKPTADNNIVISSYGDCTYYKIGKMVYIQGYMYARAASASGGQNIIGGLPFTPSGVKQHIGITYSNAMMAGTNWGKMDLETRLNEPKLQLVYWANGRSWDGDCCLSATTNGYFYFSGWYLTNE